MGNFVLATCRNKKAAINDTQRYRTRKLEQEMYLPGSFEFLPKIGMEKTGKLNKELEALHTEENLQNCFKEYCNYYLDLENAESNYDKFGQISFPYFLRVYKTAFFWKKVFFEKKRLNYLE